MKNIFNGLKSIKIPPSLRAKRSNPASILDCFASLAMTGVWHSLKVRSYSQTSRWPRHILIVLLLCAFFIQSGCRTSWNTYPPPSPTATGAAIGAVGGAIIGSAAGNTAMGAAMGGIWGAAAGDILSAHMDLIERLQYNGVQVIQIGAETKLILPSDRFFYFRSPNLNRHYFPVLDMIVRLMRSYPKIDVRVAAYTDCLDSWQRNLALSRFQAREISDYLWKANVDARLIYTVGYGKAYPIAANNYKLGQQLNRRVEIVFNKIEDPIVVG